MRESTMVMITERLETLERDNRRLRRAIRGGMLAIACVLAGGVAWQAAIPDELAARRFVIRDDQGRERAVVGLNRLKDSDPWQPYVALLDERSKEAAAIRLVGGSTPLLFLSDPNGKCQFRVEGAPDSIAAYLIRDEKVRSLLGISPAGDVGLSLRDADDRGRLQVAVMGDGNSGFTLRGPTGDKRFALEAAPDGAVNVGVFDPGNVMRLGFGQIGENATLRGMARDRAGNTAAVWSGDALRAVGGEGNQADQAAAPADGTLRARRVLLSDAQGRERMLLDADVEGVPTIALRDPDGVDRTTIRLAQGGFGEFLMYRQDGEPILCAAEAENAAGSPFFALYGEGRVGRAELGLDGEGRSHLTLLDSEARIRAVFEQAAEGQPSLGIHDSNGQARAELFIRPREEGEAVVEDVVLSLNNAQGAPRMQAKTQGDDYSSVAFFDETGADRFTLLSSPNGAQNLAFFDTERHTRLQLGISAGGVGGLALNDENNVERIGMEVLRDGNRPVVRLTGPEGQVRAALSTTEAGSGFVVTYGEGGAESFKGPQLILEDVKQP